MEKQETAEQVQRAIAEAFEALAVLKRLEAYLMEDCARRVTIQGTRTGKRSFSAWRGFGGDNEARDCEGVGEAIRRVV